MTKGIVFSNDKKKSARNFEKLHDLTENLGNAILFLVYIDDLTLDENTKISISADDTSIISILENKIKQ